MRTIEDLGISPAPWKIVEIGRPLVVISDDGNFVCDINYKNELPDARLISAAPELYEALRVVVEAFDRGYGLQMTIKEARSALEKAEGEEVAK